MAWRPASGVLRPTGSGQRLSRARASAAVWPHVTGGATAGCLRVRSLGARGSADRLPHQADALADSFASAVRSCPVSAGFEGGLRRCVRTSSRHRGTARGPPPEIAGCRSKTPPGRDLSHCMPCGRVVRAPSSGSSRRRSMRSADGRIVLERVLGGSRARASRYRRDDQAGPTAYGTGTSGAGCVCAPAIGRPKHVAALVARSAQSRGEAGLIVRRS